MQALFSFYVFLAMKQQFIDGKNTTWYNEIKLQPYKYAGVHIRKVYMKRITAFALAIVMMLSLIGCSSQKPETVVEDCCKAIQAFDMEKAAACMQNGEEDLKEFEEMQKELDARTASIPEEEKPSVYVGGVSFKGQHGFEGTEAYYGPFELIHANNLANATDQTGAFNIDVEQVLAWDPEFIFLDFNGMTLINEEYANNPDFYEALTAVQEGRVYSQISFRSSASNLETALADAYYAACIMFPEQFADVDPVEKAGEIFTMLLGTNPYEDLKEAGYEFRPIIIGE